MGGSSWSTATPRTPTAPTWSSGARRASSTTYVRVNASPTGSPRCFPTAASPSPPTSTSRLRPTDTGTDLDVDYRITDSTVDSADFIAGIEIGFGQSLDKLAATIAADPDSTHHDRDRPKTRSTK